MITNPLNQVAIKHYQTIPHVVKARDTEYAFVVRANICLAWINAEHVESIINKTKTCCGSGKRNIYFYANESDVRRWTNGGGQ